MSISCYWYLEKYNPKTGKYENIAPLVPRGYGEKKDEMVPADFWPWNACHELYAMLNLVSRGDCDDEDKVSAVSCGLPHDVSPEVKEAYDSFSDDYKPDVRYISLSELYIAMKEHPKVKDYDADWKEDAEGNYIPEYKETPLASVYNRAMAFLEIWDGWDIMSARANSRLVMWNVW